MQLLLGLLGPRVVGATGADHSLVQFLELLGAHAAVGGRGGRVLHVRPHDEQIVRPEL